VHHENGECCKVEKAQDANTAMRPYSDNTEILQNLGETMEEWFWRCTQNNVKSIKTLVVAVASNRGLAGAFNSNIMKELVRLNNNELVGVAVSYMTMGKKQMTLLRGTNNAPNHSGLFDDLSDNVAMDRELMELYATGAYDKIVIVYNSFKNQLHKSCGRLLTTKAY
jgi:F-type H+-transporting ATPase subunit gamma